MQRATLCTLITGENLILVLMVRVGMGTVRVRCGGS
jgi:hypothetical protein